jgi:hypothetical protein
MCLLISIILLTGFANNTLLPKTFAATAYSTNATFGSTTVGACILKLTLGQKVSCSFQAPQTGTITSVSIYAEALQANSQVLLGVYSNLNGQPDQLIAKSSRVTVGNGYAWVTASLAATISAGQTYWLTMLPTSTVYCKYSTSGVSEMGFGKDGTTLSTSFGLFERWQAAQMSIYATYTATTSTSATPSPTPIPTPPPSTPTPTPSPTPSPSPSANSAVQLGVFSNSACTTGESSISWGQLTPGETSTITLYVLNEGTQPVTLSLSLTNLSPTSLSSYLSLTWNYGGQTLKPSASLAVTLSLAVSATASGTSNFSFNTVITGTSS